MEHIVNVLGMIIKAEPYGEFDRRVVILTKERGKITAYAKGARKTHSQFAAATNAFCFGNFKLYEYKNSYSMSEANILNYFDGCLTNLDIAVLGMYFLEIADYYTRENQNECDMLKLLYQSLTALNTNCIDRDLVKAIFEIKSIMVNGEYPGIDNIEYREATKRAIDYIYNIAPERVYSFKVSDEIKKELVCEAKRASDRTFERKFTSLEILKSFESIT